MDNKLKILTVAVGILIVCFIGIGLVRNYNGFTENREEKIIETYTGDAIQTKPNANEERQRQEPKLELTQKYVYIEIGAVFDPLDYIKIAQDTYGYNVKEKVEVDQKIPTDKPGKYEVIYVLNMDAGNTVEKKLVVEVTKMSSDE